METLYGAPFKIDITSLPSIITTTSKNRKKSLGRGRNKKNRQILFNIDINSLYEIRNEDNYCLFRALELLRARQRLSNLNFFNYRNDLIKQIDDVENLLLECEIEKDLDAYDIETYGDAIQTYYNRIQPG